MTCDMKPKKAKLESLSRICVRMHHVSGYSKKSQNKSRAMLNEKQIS
jgi:hypothetical protein